MLWMTWNLFHGRAIPEQPHDLYDQFEHTIGGLQWDVLMLQECPPWWPRKLARRFGVDYRRAKTSRNFMLPVRRALAIRRPDIIKANGGGCNAILVRDREIVEHRKQVIRHIPERRSVHGVKCGDGLWICNLHLQGARSHLRPPNPIVETLRAGVVATRWAGEDAPILLGGDFNVSKPTVVGFEHIDGHRGVDQLFVRNLEFTGKATAVERGTLSDHRPVRANIST